MIEKDGASMYRKIIKGILLVMLVMQIVELPIMYFHLDQNLNAANSTRKSTLDEYDQIKMGGKEYITVNGGFLLKGSLGNRFFDDAFDQAYGFYLKAGFNKKEGNLVNKSNIPIIEDLDGNINVNTLNSGIPSMNNWWLYDHSDIRGITRSYVNSLNQIDAGRTEKYLQGNGTTCTLTECQVSKGGLIGNLDNLYTDYYIDGVGNGSTTGTYDLYLIKNTLANHEVQNLNSGRKAYLPLNAQYELYLPTGHASGTGVTMSSGETYITFPPIEKAYNEYSVQSPANMQVLKKVTSSGSGNSLTITYTKTFPCTQTLQPQVSAETRPIVKMKPYTVFAATTEKDQSVGSSLESYPSSGVGPYNIQIQSDTLKLALDDTDASVKKENTIEIVLEDVYDNGLISIPYDTSGSTYDKGSVYISAMMDDDHYKKLDFSTQNGSGTAILDINNIAKKDDNGNIIPQEITLNLYQEEITDDGHMDFISEPLQITIKIRAEQAIEQLAGDLSETNYGTPITLHFKEIGTNFSSEPITYSLSSTDQAYASLTDMGNGSVLLTPKTGNKIINVLVDKAGDSLYSDAPQLKVPIQLHKKAITIKADSFNKEIGDPVPEYTVSAGEGDLVTGDTIPIGIKGVTTYTPVDGKLMTQTNGVDITVSEDESAEVLSFKEKYMITYQKGILKVGVVNLDEASLDITPSPNTKGWHKTDVVIKPNTYAITKGYTKIALNGDTARNQITLSESRKKEDMRFVLYTDGGASTDDITLTKDINIDKTGPTVTIDVEKIPETLSAKILKMLTGGVFYKGGFIVTVTATDEESGIDTIISPNGTGTITTSGKTKTLTYTVSENFKGIISAEAVNMAGIDTTETTPIVVNENNNQTIAIQPTGVSGHINAEDVFEAKLNAAVSANQSGLKEISYIVDGTETNLQTYTSNDAEDGSLTLTDNIVIPLTAIIQNAPTNQDELIVTIKVTTNSGNTLARDVTIQYDINAATISIISVEKEDDWAYQKQVDFNVNEEGSGIASITVMKPDGSQAIVNGELSGTVFNFIADQSGVYVIDVDDKAGNKALQISKNITKIDRDIPSITDVSITPDNDTWADKKIVSFHVLDPVDADSGSGVDQDSIKITNTSGTEETITCTGNKDDVTCNFEVTKEDTYTIDVNDLAGNNAVSKDVEVQKIDTSHVDITDVENDGSGADDDWFNTGRIVTFKITVGQSGLKTDMPQVLMGSDSLTVTNNGSGTYSFTAPKNGAYKIIAESEIGDKKEVTGVISKIDKTAPTISDLKLEQERDLTQHNPRVNISFKTTDHESGIAKVSYGSDGTEILLSSENDTYSFMTSENGTYTITVVDEAGNSEMITAKVSIPKINMQPVDLSVYEKDALSLSIKADMNDTLQTGRTYEWFYINEEGTETSIKTGTLSSEDSEQTIPFPYSEAKTEYNGNYRCMIKNGNGFYNWSAMFKLTVISDPVTGLVMIPSEIEMKDMNDGSETAQAVFNIELGTTGGNTVPASKFYIETVKELLLKDIGTKDSYKAKVYREAGGSYLPYESGSIAELDYNGIKKQKVKLMMPVKEYHEQGIYHGVLRFIIHYGEGGAGE